MINQSLENVLNRLIDLKTSQDPSAEKEIILSMFEAISLVACIPKYFNYFWRERDKDPATIQFRITDTDETFWIAARRNRITYGEGKGPYVTITVHTTKQKVLEALYEGTEGSNTFLIYGENLEYKNPKKLNHADLLEEMAELCREYLYDMIHEGLIWNFSKKLEPYTLDKLFDLYYNKRQNSE
jgi:hypothetical protein